jgi:glycosyltransferase involved in cell wall biosynthesis
MSGQAYRTGIETTTQAHMRVFVLLAYTFGAQRWKESWARGEIPGIQERLPYGYFHCAGETCEIRYSEDARESRLVRFLRMCLRRVIGFDLIHAWRNREGIVQADVVWTHSEIEHLAVLLLFCLGLARNRRPRLIAQSIWLFDRWRHISAFRRWAYRRLLDHADILTVLSPENLRIVRELFPGKRSELVFFGIDSSKMRAVKRREPGSRIRILSLGNDMHRDWVTLIKALGGWNHCEVKIGGKRIGCRIRRQVHKFANFEIVMPKLAVEIDRLYDWADFVVVPLKRNFHASGITVIIEAVLSGVPVICSDTGGLYAYFSREEVRYVPRADPVGLRDAIEQLSRSDDQRYTLARRAQARVISQELNSRAFANRHYQISRMLLEQPPKESSVRATIRIPSADCVRVFVLLAHGFGGREWTRRWEAGKIGGINERLPYGYFHAAGDGWTIGYSDDKSELLVIKYFRSGLRLILGCDLIHAWRNREEIKGADIVWTHTENEYFALLVLFHLGLARDRRPRLIAQSIWLFDRWYQISAFRRWVYRRLLEYADVLTVLSPENERMARTLFPEKSVEFIPFGVDSAAVKPALRRETHHPLHVLSLGNDIHRDWKTLIDAVKTIDDCEVRIGGKRIRWRTHGWGRGVRQIVMRASASAREVKDLYESWADLVVVPLKPNLHASGITVIAEAVSSGVAVICTDTGGLRAYFSEEEVRYVAPGDAVALRNAIVELGGNVDLRYRMIKRAQARIVSGEISSLSYALRHRVLSAKLLAMAGNHTNVAINETIDTFSISAGVAGATAFRATSSEPATGEPS